MHCQAASLKILTQWTFNYIRANYITRFLLSRYEAIGLGELG